LLLRLHEETACRRGGALALTPEDLDQEQCLIWLHEKGGTLRWQPVSPTLTTLTWVERNFGFAVAQAYAGHEDHGRGGRAMATYIRAGLPEVATALAALTGETHPLATGVPIAVAPRESRCLPGHNGPAAPSDCVIYGTRTRLPNSAP
jgi:integrase/recombinase XerC